MSDREVKKKSVRERVSRALDIPPDILSRESMIEIRGRGMITVHGCEKILLYLPEEIRLSLRHGGVFVRGAGLSCVSYSSGSVGIEGRIDGVGFLEEGEL